MVAQRVSWDFLGYVIWDAEGCWDGWMIRTAPHHHLAVAVCAGNYVRNGDGGISWAGRSISTRGLQQSRFDAWRKGVMDQEEDARRVEVTGNPILGRWQLPDTYSTTTTTAPHGCCLALQYVSV